MNIIADIKQRGLSLVELMVAVTLSLVLTAGVIQVYISSKTSYQLQQELSTLQENQRIAVELLGGYIRKAGLSSSQTIRPFPTNDTDHPVASWNGNNGAPDQIIIQYESPRDCLGNSTTDDGGDGTAIDRFFIDEGVLKCQSGAQTGPLVSGIEDMQVLYGVDTSPIELGQARTADRYVLPSVDNMDDVVSVRIALLFKTSGAVRTADEADEVTRTYQLLDAPEKTFPDQQFRRDVITTTIALRNSN